MIQDEYIKKLEYIIQTVLDAIKQSYGSTEYFFFDYKKKIYIQVIPKSAKEEHGFSYKEISEEEYIKNNLRVWDTE